MTSQVINTFIGFLFFAVVLVSSIWLWRRARRVLRPDEAPSKSDKEQKKNMSLNELLGYDFVRVVTKMVDTEPKENETETDMVSLPSAEGQTERKFESVTSDGEEEEPWPTEEDMNFQDPVIDDKYMDWLIGADEDEQSEENGSEEEYEDEDEPNEHFDPTPTDEDDEEARKVTEEFAKLFGNG